MNIPRWLANTLKGCGCLFLLFAIAVILFPVFAKQRDHRVYCPSREKQIGLGILQYVQDNDEFLPNISETPGSAATWRMAIFPYVKSHDVFQCDERDEEAAKALGSDGLHRPYAANYSGNDSGAL